MKIFFKILLSVIVAIVVAVVGVGVYFLVSVNDSTNNTPSSIKENNYPVQRVINTTIADSLSQEEEDITINLDENTINEIIYGLVQQINVSNLTFLGAYATFNDNNNLIVELPCKVSFITTNIKLEIKLTEENEKITLKLVSGLVGNLSLDNGLVQLGINISNLKSTITNLLKQNIGEFTLDLDKYEATFSKDDILKIIDNKLASDDNASLYKLLVSLCLSKEEAVTFHLNEGKYLGFVLKSSNMKYLASRDGAIEYTLDYDSIMTSLKQELNNGVDYTNITPVFNYYVFGYTGLDEDSKKVIDTLNYSKYYEGIKQSSESTMASIILGQEPSVGDLAKILLAKTYSITINESQFNAIFEALGFIGKTFAFASTNNIGYFSIESMYINIEDNAFRISLIMNINGRQLVVNASFSSPISNELKINATLTSLSIGSITLEDSYYELILSYLSSILKDQNWISVDASTNMVTIDLESILNQGSVFNQLESHVSSRELSFKSKLLGNGELKLTYTLQ